MKPAHSQILLSLYSFLYSTFTTIDSYEDTCYVIKEAVSESSESAGVFFPGSAQYETAIYHWLNSSSQQAACAFVPGNTEDISTALKILGNFRIPFGVKSGGHSFNAGFSSTPGVQISLSNFREIKVDEKTSTVRLGPGLAWDEVYAALVPLNLNVPGGRANGTVGVGGFISGGGLSWHMNQRGLTIDSVVAFDLVAPNGTFVEVTEASHPDLFFGLKGGQNNFGIITAFTLKTFPQGLVWGGSVVFAGDKAHELAKVIADFNTNNVDPKACIVPIYAFVGGSFSINALLFYDAPTPPAGLFDEFFAIDSTSKKIGTKDMLSYVMSAYPLSGITVGTSHVVSLLNFTQNILDIVANETTFWGNKLAGNSVTMVSYNVEPFLASFVTHSTPSAYPHDTPLQPLNLFWTWTDPTQSKTVVDAMRASAERVYEAAIAEGQDISIEAGRQIRYPNYCLWDVPLDQIYGSNLPRLRALRMQYDPQSVMSLTGGFRF